MRCIRIWFEKTGNVKYVSHLDTMRCMQRAVRRAQIPLWYTEGFNPHPYLNFLSPLSLGIEGKNEPLDIRIEGDMTDGEIMSRLNDVLPEGIRIKRITEPFHKTAEIAYADYTVIFENTDGFAPKLREALEAGGLTCEKTGKSKGKKQIRTVDVSAGIVKYDISENGEAVTLNVILPCGNENNLNPMNLLAALKKVFGYDIIPLSSVRNGVLLSDFTAFD